MKVPSRPDARCLDCGVPITPQAERCRPCGVLVRSKSATAGITYRNVTGLCECGCGRPAPIAQSSNVRRGWVRGEALRFVKGHMRKGPREPLAARFWSHVTTTDGCWLWTGRIGRKGYGLLDVAGLGRHKPTLAHRISYELATGAAIPHGLKVLHRCDNPPCVRPDHLFLGTITDNNRDAAAKGHFSTQARLEASRRNRAKSSAVRHARTKERNRNICRLYAKGVSRRDICGQFSLSRSQVLDIIAKGRTKKARQ